MKENEIIKLCIQGQRLCKTIGVNRRRNPVINFHLEPSGIHVSKKLAANLLDDGLFEPVGDGLFAETSQTFRLKTSDGAGQ